ncbi:Fc receptor-like protein 4 [Zonotrichia albicollis]|uniref:Fc receptor-like protein 4 n=1 Tax=Zonotrichia albicollis TaxID=44394 RepID=UPI003D80EEC0
MAGDTGMAGKVVLLLWAQTLGLAGAQTTQLLVEPPWRPAVLWDRVTLTCQGLGTASPTTWYKEERHLWQEGQDHLTITESGTYTCERPSTGLSLPMTVSDGDRGLRSPSLAPTVAPRALGGLCSMGDQSLSSALKTSKSFPE